MMRVKLGLTDKELMDSPWISLVIATNDFPWYDYKAKKGEDGKERIKVSDPEQIAAILGKHKI